MGIEPVERAGFTRNANGRFDGSFDLASGDGVEGPVDPRGRYLVVDDGHEDVLAGWPFGAPENDGPMTKAEERTRLAPDEEEEPTGAAEARFDPTPDAMARDVALDFEVSDTSSVELALQRPSPPGPTASRRPRAGSLGPALVAGRGRSGRGRVGSRPMGYHVAILRTAGGKKRPSEGTG